MILVGRFFSWLALSGQKGDNDSKHSDDQIPTRFISRKKLAGETPGVTMSSMD